LPVNKKDPLKYKHDYIAIFKDIEAGKLPEAATYRTLILTDLFFIVCFVMGIEKANHPFVVKQCRMIEDGDAGDTIDVWARFHFKSTIITIAETLQYHLKNPDHCTGIIAYARPLAKKFLQAIKELCETSDLLKTAFPDVLYGNPERESAKWSLDEGISFKSSNPARKESTIEAYGLIEGSPVGRHYERIIFDDIETEDISGSPDMMDKVFSKFEITYGNLGTGSDSDIIRIIGTYYSHTGPITRIQEMKYPDSDETIFKLRKVPASVDGTASGDPVLIDTNTWRKLKASRHFNSQQLCDPTPRGDVKLDSSMMTYIDQEFIPHDRIKFMIVDPAGDKEKQPTGRDGWAFGVISVVIERMSHAESVDNGTRMYLRNGMIQQVAIEKIGQATYDEHLITALRAKHRHISVDAGSLLLIKSDKKNKKNEIESALQWPLANGKIRYSSAIPQVYIDRLKAEMDKFPFWHDDGLDILKMLYQKVLPQFRFPTATAQKPMRSTRISVA
jgi:hypothetical protein